MKLVHRNEQLPVVYTESALILMSLFHVLCILHKAVTKESAGILWIHHSEKLVMLYFAVFKKIFCSFLGQFEACHSKLNETMQSRWS